MVKEFGETTVPDLSSLLNQRLLIAHLETKCLETWLSMHKGHRAIFEELSYHLPQNWKPNSPVYADTLIDTIWDQKYIKPETKATLTLILREYLI